MVCDEHSAKSASIFLEKILETAPFKIRAIQTDQGSEFRGDFEAAAEKLGVTYYYLPPREVFVRVVSVLVNFF